MIREKVALLLNERESRKAELALQLEHLLLDEHIQASRISPDKNLLKTLDAFQPGRIVTDFILDEFGTG